MLCWPNCNYPMHLEETKLHLFWDSLSSIGPEYWFYWVGFDIIASTFIERCYWEIALLFPVKILFQASSTYSSLSQRWSIYFRINWGQKLSSPKRFIWNILRDNERYVTGMLSVLLCSQVIWKPISQLNFLAKQALQVIPIHAKVWESRALHYFQRIALPGVVSLLLLGEITWQFKSRALTPLFSDSPCYGIDVCDPLQRVR